ncbi:MAG: hypothetical protein ACK5VV_13825 [Lysobacteraceae bacterium]
MSRLSALALALSLALPGAGLAARTADAAASLPMPVWNSSSGKLEAVLWIDTATLGDLAPRPTLGARWTRRSGGLSVAVGAGSEPKFGLLCGNARGAFQGVADDCLVAELGRPAPLASNSLSAQGTVSLGRTEWTAFGRQQRQALDALFPGTSAALLMPELAPAAGLAGLAVEQNDLGIVGELRIGEQGWVRVGGSVARARLLPADSALPGLMAPRWNSQTLSVGGGVGALGGEVVGRVVRVPGKAEAYETFGLGLTWRTPWSGRLTVGAQNLMSTGENPLRPRTKGQDGLERSEGRVPYVRYQQDL